MKIHRVILSALAAIAVALPAAAQNTTAADAFKSAPRNVVPLIEPSTRLDMIDYFNAGSDKASRNTLYGNSRITELTPERIVIEATAATTIEMVALPAGSDTIIAVITTRATPVPDSKVTLWTSAWENVTSRSFKEPDIADWLTPGAGRDAVESALPFMLVSCSYDPATKTFTFTNRSMEFIGEEVYEPLKPLLRETLAYGWDGRRLALRK